MYLPRVLISHLYQHLIRTRHSLAPPVLLLVALDPDALCACRILVALLKRDYIQHTIQPVSGYGDLSLAGKTLVEPMKTQNGGNGGLVVCLGVGGLVDLASVLGLQAADEEEDPSGGVEVWLIDARRPWNLGNVFGGNPVAAMMKDDSTQQSQKFVGVENGRIEKAFIPGRGGIIVYDDGDIDEELSAERDAYCKLIHMPDVEDSGEDSSSSGSDSEPEDLVEGARSTKKRKSWSDRDSDADRSESEDGRPRQRRRSTSDRSTSESPDGHIRQDYPISTIEMNGQTPSGALELSTKIGSARTLRRRLLRLRRQHMAVLSAYYARGASYSEPASSIMYSLAEDLGRENNDLLWYAIVGIGSLELYGRGMTGVGISRSLESGGSSGWGGERGERIRQLLRDEVRRLNPPDRPDSSLPEYTRGEVSGVIPTAAISPTDTSIRLSPEPRFLLIRHWSLYDSMLHSPYLSARLQIWSDAGRKRLHKFLAKMGISLSQSKQNYAHMHMDLKRTLRQRLLANASLYGLEGLVPPVSGARRGKEGWGFVRSWGWKACLSANDVGVIIGSILEVGKSGFHSASTVQGLDRGKVVQTELIDEDGKAEAEEWVGRFWQAYDALERIEELMKALPTAQHLHRAILRTGTELIEKHQIRDLRAFRMAVVKEGQDVSLFTHPSALTRLALWVGEAVAEQERVKRGKAGKGTPLVLAGLNKARGVYVVVGTGGAGGVVDFVARQKRKEKAEMIAKRREEKRLEKEKKRNEKLNRSDDEDQGDEEDETEEENESSDDENDGLENRGYGRNRFGNAFQEVVDETNARVRTDSFEHCVVEVKKEDLSTFLESLSTKTVVG